MQQTPTVVTERSALATDSRAFRENRGGGAVVVVVDEFFFRNRVVVKK